MLQPSTTPDQQGVSRRGGERVPVARERMGQLVKLSETILIDEMVAALNKNDGRVLAAVRVIVQSPQFRMIRGSEFVE